MLREVILNTGRFGSRENVNVKTEAANIVIDKQSQERLDVRLEQTPYIAVTNTEILEILNTLGM